MPRLFSIRYTPLRTCLVNLPMSLYGPLAAKQVRPQRLAVHVSLPGSSDGVYLGWTGMASASSLSKWQQGAQAAVEALDTIEIDPQVAQSYGFKDGTTVEIGLVHNLPIATNVETVPLSSDDWEILETHAEYVEQNLLSQVRAVAVGQEISVWAMGRSRVQFRVVSTKPEGQAVLLGPDTEVAIAPKLRAPPKVSTPQTQKTSEDKPPAEIRNRSTPSASVNDPFPLALRVFPIRLASAFVGVGSSEIEVHISSTHAQQLSQDPNSSCTHAWLARVRPPLSVREFDKRGKPVEKVTPAPVVLQQNKKEEKKSDESRAHVPGVLVRVKVHEDVPVGHAVAVGLESKMQEWDTILLTCSDQPSEATSRSSSPSQTALTEVHAQKPATDAEGSELAGVDSILADCHDFFVRTYMQSDAFGTAGGLHLPGLLLHGAPGSGKTSVARSVVKKLEADPRIHACVVYVDLAQMADEHTSTLRSKFKTWKAVAAWRQPSVLVLDNLDKVVSAEVEHTDSARARHLAEHFLDVFSASPARGVAILATCASPSALHPLLASSHVFACKVQLRAPDKAARRDILSRIVRRRFATSDLKSDAAKPLNFVALATDTEGYSATDLQDLVGRAVHAAAMRSAADEVGSSPVLLPVDFAKAQEDFVPLSLRGVKLQKSEVSWSDIGGESLNLCTRRLDNDTVGLGLEETRRVLRETLEWPTKYGPIFAKCPLRLRSGLLLYGYPGCGKTLLASAVAKECGLNFISVKGPELLNKYIGQSEQSVRDIFDRASSAKPCVLFLDEFDSIAPKRGHDSTGVTDRVVNQMLTQMDGAEGLDGVYVLAATSRPDLIDPALLRPGRLDKSLLCHMPTERERHDILKAVSRKVSLAPDVELAEVAKRTEGYSGADLQALVYNAQLEVVHEELAVASQSLATSGSSSRTEKQIKVEIVGGPKDSTTMTRAEAAILEKRVATMLAARTPKQPRTTDTRHKVRGEKQRSQITLAHLERSLENHRPSVSPEERWRLQTIYDAFQTDRTGEHKVPPGLSGAFLALSKPVLPPPESNSAATTMAAPAARRAPSPSASTTYSGISNYRSESYRTGASNSPRPGGPALPATDPRAIARTHYEELKRSLQDHMLREPQNSRANAREKLTRLTRQQFQELSTDVYDELMRRNDNEKSGAETPFLPVRDDFHPKRNQARQKLATLPPIRFKDLSSDVFYELGRRYPEFKEPETLPETPDTPQSDYDPPTPELVGGRAPMRQASRDQNFSANGAGSGSDRRRPSQDDYGVRRRPSEDEPRRQRSVDRRPSGDEGPYRRPSQDSQVTRRPSQDKPAGTASSSYVTPNKSTIAEEVIQVPYGRDEGTEDEDEEDRDDVGHRPGSDDDPSRHSKKPSQGGLNALGFSLLSTPLSPTSDDGAAPNGLNGRATSDYYEKMSFGRASVTSSQGGGGAERRNTEVEDVRREYEFKIATMQNKLAALEDKARSESERARALENDARGTAGREREWRLTLSERDAEIGRLNGELVRVRERCEQLEEDLQDAQSGQPNGASNDAGTEQLRREMQSLLEDLREMAASRDDMVAERDADTQTIRELSSQMQEYKRKYEAAKTELRGLKATSQLYVQQPANIAKQDQLPISDRGGIVDIHITAFQTLTAMKSVVTSVSAIGDDVELYIRHQRSGDHEVATQLVERLRATLSNLVAAARTHAMSYGTSPVSLLDAAASHVSTTVTSLVREVLVRRDDGRRSSASGGIGGSWVQLEDELNGRTGAGGRRPMSDRSSSVGSPQNPAIFDTPLQTASTNGIGIGSDDSTMVEGSDEGWEVLKPYLEAQSESIAFSIQALLSAIRTGAQGPEINENLTQIITIVSSIVAVSKDSLPRGGVKQGLDIIGQLSEQCDRLSELQGRAELSKQERQTMASNSFGVAKAMKELMKLG